MNVLIAISVLILSIPAWSAGSSSIALEAANNRLNDVASLRRGATLFVQRCSACHSMKYLRYSDIAEKLQWTEEDIDSQMAINGRATILDTMLGGLDEESSLAIYGKAVPDLSLRAKVRSPDWIYTFLKAYYVEDDGTTNNYLYKNVAMPNILAGDQGIMQPVYQNQHGKQVVVGTKPQQIPDSYEGRIQQEKKLLEFNSKIRDLVNFIEFASEPNKLDRYALGFKVLMFLFVLLIIMILLKQEYWRDIKH